MDNLGGHKAQPATRKVKKQQGKGEMDRLKRAEKKRRRLEKALATSAAIRSELEKKKQKKKEEQQRLDEEAAAIAEAVALHVLLGEDSEDSHKIVLDQYEDPNPWNYPNHVNFVMGGRSTSSSYRGSPKCSLERIGWFPGAHGPGFRWGGSEGSNWSLSSGNHGRNLCELKTDSVGWIDGDLSPDLSRRSWLISPDPRGCSHGRIVDRMLRG